MQMLISFNICRQHVGTDVFWTYIGIFCLSFLLEQFTKTNLMSSEMFCVTFSAKREEKDLSFLACL